MISVTEALERVLALANPPRPEIVSLADAHGRALLQPAVSRLTQPPFDASAMDGYATSGEGPWDIVGEARAGAPFPKMLATGFAVRISTGAHMPHGADAVLVQEQAQVDGDRLTALEPPQERFIRRAGLDFAASDILLEPGTRMSAAQIALARAGGVADVVAHDRPDVAIIECGDELHADPATCEPGGIPATNGAMLATMAREGGAAPHAADPVPDDAQALVRAIEQASESAPLVVVSGGASVGPHDLVKPALEAAGFSLEFWRVAIKPGKPLLVATRGQTVVLGLPGNPVSSFVTAFFFMVPAIRKLSGAAQCLPRAIPMPLAAALPEGGKRREFLRAAWRDAGVVAADVQDSSALRPLAHAQVLIDRPANTSASEAGAFVPCYPLENGGYA